MYHTNANTTGILDRNTRDIVTVLTPCKRD